MPSVEQKIQAIRWRLGIKPTGDDKKAEQLWREELCHDAELLSQISENLTDLMRQVFRYRLDIGAPLSDEARTLDNYVWSKFTEWLSDGKEIPLSAHAQVSGVLKHALVKKVVGPVKDQVHQTNPSAPGARVGSSPARPSHQSNEPRPIASAGPGTLPSRQRQQTPGSPGSKPGGSHQMMKPVDRTQPAPAPPPTFQGSSSSPPESPADVTSNPAESAPMSPPSSMWKIQPVPDDPDKHEESACHALDAPAGMKILGARVRGKKHKHEGTNCDDWFEIAGAGPWALIAVSDGAGSKKFSRVGALASTYAAIESLKETLKDHQIGPRDDWDNILRRDETTRVFADRDVERVQIALHKAMRAAHEAVRTAADQRAGHDKYSRLLPGGRSLDVQDLSATLLLAVHTTIRHEDQDFSFAMACQIGDGMTGAEAGRDAHAVGCLRQRRVLG